MNGNGYNNRQQQKEEQNMKATKATEKRLEKAAWTDEIAQTLFIAVDAAKYGDEHSGTYYVTDDGLLQFKSFVDEHMNIMRGLQGKYPELVTVYNTHDLQYALIHDINKLAKKYFKKVLDNEL